MHDLARRSLAKRWLIDRCRVTEAVDRSEGSLDPSDMTVSFADPPVVFEGACKVAPRQSSVLRVTAGQELQVDESWCVLPPNAPSLRAGMLVSVTASGDPDLVGAVFEVRRAVGSTHGALRRAVVVRRVAHPGPGGVAA